MVKHLILALAVTALWPLQTLAQNYRDNALAQAMVEELVAEEGFDRAQLEILFSKAERQQSIIDAMSRPAEKTKPWYEYRQIFLTEKREREGREFYLRHRDTLERAEAETGVPAEIIVAIIGVETFYGRITGSYRVMDALSTLAFDYPQRSAFFTKELKNYLLLTRDQELDPMAIKGSYAGAMGYGQFMPSSYRSYAVDFDGDGKTDIWNNPVDAIGSVANYFVRHGWVAGEPVVTAASVVGEVPEEWFNASLKPEQTVAEFSSSGLRPVMDGLAPDAPATAIRFELENGYEYWMGLNNFYVITRYNHSSMYAMSVYQLSQRIARGVQS